MVSGSLASGSITIAGGDVGADGDGVLTPQQLGVMGKFFFSEWLKTSIRELNDFF